VADRSDASASGREDYIFWRYARVPYGSKSKETVTKYSRQIVSFKDTDVKAIVIACNTAVPTLLKK
jgi:glutamate racemase